MIVVSGVLWMTSQGAYLLLVDGNGNAGGGPSVRRCLLHVAHISKACNVGLRNSTPVLRLETMYYMHTIIPCMLRIYFWPKLELKT